LLLHESASVGVMAALFPVTLLGVKASMQLASTLFTGLLTAGVVLLDAVYGVSIMPFMSLLTPGGS
ncbi:hypothetical protein T492DRAFT_865930, partial [Pavlovales sp. CCMP2436]